MVDEKRATGSLTVRKSVCVSSVEPLDEYEVREEELEEGKNGVSSPVSICGKGTKSNGSMGMSRSEESKIEGKSVVFPIMNIRIK